MKCRLCGSDYTVSRRLGETAVISCHTCKVTFLAQNRTAGEQEEYYARGYRMTAPDYASTEGRRFARWPEQVRLVDQLARVKGPPGSVLDVGCDRGAFLFEMKRRGYTVTGVEPSIEARHYCAGTGLDVKASLDKVDGPFDIISIWHTLEHVEEPNAFLDRLRGLLAPSGLVAIRVPDFGCVWRRVLREHWIWFQPRNHCFHYTAEALTWLLNARGFIVLQMRSQRPNDDLTRAADALAARTLQHHLQHRTTFRRRVARAYEDLTGVELLALARRDD